MEVEMEWRGEDPDDLARRLDRFADELDGHLVSAVDDIATKVQADAQRLVNVDTGQLRSSIEHVVEQVAGGQVRGMVGSNVDYALWHELDYPYLRPAIEENREFIEERVREALTDAWEATA